MSTYKEGNIILHVGMQDFDKGTVPITVNDKTVDCPMGMDDDNDIYFVYEGKEIYFRWLE